MIVDLTGIATSCIAGFFGLLSIAVPSIIDRNMKNKQAASVLSEAVKNSLGAMQQASSVAARTLSSGATIRGVPAPLQPGVQYVLDNAGHEMELLGVTPERVAAKVLAQIGLAEVKTNQAVASSATSLVPPPLGPVPVRDEAGGAAGSRVL